MANKCKECGCTCKQCLQKNSEIHLHAEIENLRQRLLERDNHIVTMETQFLNDANKFPNGELASIREEILIWQDKYARLYEAHKRMQKVNQNLEDKLLRIVDKCETEKGAFIKDIATLSHRLADANYAIHRLKQDNDKYRNDVNLAIQLLQCKPSNFIGQKYDTLPFEVQAKVRSYVAQKSRSPEDMSNNDVKSITVPISSFPPTAMVYSVTKTPTEKSVDTEDSSPPVEIVSASIMARVLEDREKERIFGKHCSTCSCSKTILKVDTETQTTESQFNEPSNLPSQNPIVIGYVDENETATIRFNGQHNSKPRSNDIKTKSLEIKRNNRNGESLGKSVNRNTGSAVKTLNKSSKLDEVEYNWGKMNGKDVKELRNIEEESGKRKVRQEEIINERLYKNSWKKYSEELGEEKKEGSEIEKIDAINNRVWRKPRCLRDEPRSINVTVIEVANADELPTQNQQTETTSPSFSSDSVVISSSDPSSLSSDTKSGTNYENSRTEKSSSRNCLVRVKPGSKNILLDSIGTYQTVLYTSGTERPNTILVHSKPRLDRSDSISSEDNASDVLTREPSQLQRVAAWVESSNAIKVDDRKERKSFRKPQKVLPIFTENRKKDEVEMESKEKDLITFEVSSEEDNRDSFRDRVKNLDYEVKVTKEMEETYLKLTASLDPTALKLDESEKMGITIEKYRQDHKKCVQKMKSQCL